MLDSLDSEKIKGGLRLKVEGKKEELVGESKKGKRKASVLLDGRTSLPIIDTSSEEPTISTNLDELLATLDSVDCCETVGRSILEWYGSYGDNGEWEVRIRDVVREIGIALLAEGGVSFPFFFLILEIDSLPKRREKGRIALKSNSKLKTF